MFDTKETKASGFRNLFKRDRPITVQDAIPKLQTLLKMHRSPELLGELFEVNGLTAAFHPSSVRMVNTIRHTLQLVTDSCHSLRLPILSMSSRYFSMRDNRANQLNPNNKEFWGSRNFGKHARALMRTQTRQDHMLEQWSQTVRVAALGDDSYFLSHGNGQTSWGGIPVELDRLVRKKEVDGTSVTYLALGPGNQYFVLFDDDEAHWIEHSEQLTQVVEDRWSSRSSDVNLVAFAPDGGYFVKFNDGWWQFQNLPTKLHNFLKSNRPRIRSIGAMSISEDGTGWFVSFLDGKRPQFKANGLPCRVMQFIGGKKNSGTIRAVELGSSGNWLIRSTRPVN
mmetsp:Transcript_155107/g.297638  ORF Transcript_155107/g.297638 Transcript_155107/m.297638 type:complete len:338 (-) Transcript_155107:255-1268(-)